MTWIDWTVLMGTLTAIVGYGTWKTRQQRTLSAYLKGDNSMKWWTIGLSVMATQASAITFLSTPGQAYESGMGFVQFYFGLPLAMVVISAIFIPRYYGLKVFTAYEYLENRFGLPARLFTAFLFLISRGLAAGITIYAPAIVLSTLLGWNLWLTNIMVGILVIVYTVSGGTKAVSITQKWQMAVIFTGMFLAFFLILNDLPDALSFGQAVDIAGMLGKMEVVDTSFDLENRYTLWTGLLGGFFLALSYFGTDQSQVQRYLGGKNISESRLGLLFNGLLKIPMQFFILFVGILVFVFYQFHTPPAFFNQPGKEAAYATEYAGEIRNLETEFETIHAEKKELLNAYIAGDVKAQTQIVEKERELQEVRTEIKEKIHEAAPNVETRDTDYVFLTFILNHLPSGVVGLLLAVILSAAMSSTAGELNALASTTYIDYYQRLGKRELSDAQQVRVSKLLTAGWGVLAIIIALSAQLYENLIQLVNLLGSLFYGTILGIFVVAFFLRFVRGRAVLFAGFIGQGTVVLLHLLTVFNVIELGYLWYNVIGCGVVVIFAALIQSFESQQHEPEDQHL